MSYPTDGTGESRAPDGRIWITRARCKRLVDSLTGGAPALENQVKQVLNTEFAVIDPLPLLVITSEAREALIRLVGGLLFGSVSFGARPGEDARAFAERLLNEYLEIVDA